MCGRPAAQAIGDVSAGVGRYETASSTGMDGHCSADRREELERQRVDPVAILQHEDERCLSGTAPENANKE